MRSVTWACTTRCERHRPFVVSAIVAAAALGAAIAVAAPALAEARQPSAKPAPPRTAPSDAEGVVNLNAATAEQLQLLPGIGPAKASRILAQRAKRRFKAPHELVRVRGVGRRTFARLRPYLTVDGPTTLTRKPRPKGDS